MKRIEFGELRIGEVARKNLMEVCDSNWASFGPKVAALEKGWSDLFGFKSSVAMSSGTDACINACLALYDLKKAKRGDEIIVPALSFIALFVIFLVFPCLIDFALLTLFLTMPEYSRTSASPRPTPWTCSRCIF